VLWQYTDPEGNAFWLDRKITAPLRSPYGGALFTPKPKRVVPSQIGEALKEDQAPMPEARAEPDSTSDLGAFSTKVIQVALTPQCKKFHGDRAFIGSVKQLGFSQMPRAKFDSMLIEAHRKGLLRLTRADLVGAMDPNDVRNSEVTWQNTSFNFVSLEDHVPPPWKR
jgi:hypothetical protein